MIIVSCFNKKEYKQKARQKPKGGSALLFISAHFFQQKSVFLCFQKRPGKTKIAILP